MPAPPFTEILVPLDGSPAAERALGPALELVRRTGVALRVLQRAAADDGETAATYLAGWDRLRLGSVTAATVHGAAIPVLVVPAGPPGPVDRAAAPHEGAARS